ncbi:hypothetical protein M2426_004857 [Pseudomonas moraviensis]
MSPMMTVARELAPARGRSRRKSAALGVSEKTGLPGLGLLRSPAGASSLATGGVWGFGRDGLCFDLRCSRVPLPLSPMMTVARELAPARGRSRREFAALGVSGKTGLPGLGLLRSPAGASSLATGGVLEFGMDGLCCGLRCSRVPTPLSQMMTVARELAPARGRSRREFAALGVPEKTGLPGLGLLRSPAGASSLATGGMWAFGRDGLCFGLRCSTVPTPLSRMMTVARELAPARGRSRRKSTALGVSEKTGLPGLGLLRSPAGASSLATGGVLEFGRGGFCFDLRCSRVPMPLSPMITVARELAPARGRSRRKSSVLGVPEKTGLPGLGLLRSPAGASSLATGGMWAFGRGGLCFGLRCSTVPTPLSRMMTVARELAPARGRSRRKSAVLGVSGKTGLPGLGLLRSPAGASSLATGGVWAFGRGGLCFGVSNSVLGPLSRMLTVARELAPARGRSRRKSSVLGVSEKTGLPDLGLLRSPAGASSLATGDVLAFGRGGLCFDLSNSVLGPLSRMLTVARELAPARGRSRHNSAVLGVSEKTGLPGLGLLRSPAGASSLATGGVLAFGRGGLCFSLSNSVLGPLSRMMTVARELAPARGRSRLKSTALGVSEKTGLPGLGLLRSPAGASSLATGGVFEFGRGGFCFGLRCSTVPTPLSQMMTVARELAPARGRSRREFAALGVSEKTGLPGLGLLRSPAGASSLATGDVWGFGRGGLCFDLRCSRVPMPLSRMITVARELAPARGRSRRKSTVLGVSEKTALPGLGLLRSPAGASSLATVGVWGFGRGGLCFGLRCSVLGLPRHTDEVQPWVLGRSVS